MKKVIILSYFAPPCSLTPSNRIAGWMENLIHHGYYPIVITRHWDRQINTMEDTFVKTRQDITVETHEKYEIHHLPYRPKLNDNLYFRLKNSRLQFITKFLTFFQLLLENYFLKATPYFNFYNYTKDFLEENPDVNKLVVSANPFIQFQYAYRLKKKFPQLSWIADYRDDWTTSELGNPTGLKGIIRKIHQTSERKWVKTASRITSVSPFYVDKISAFTQVPGTVLQNGFRHILKHNQTNKNEIFTIVYNGSLYPSQDIEGFLQALKKVIDQFQNTLTIHIDFPGIAFNPDQVKRIKKTMTGYENNYSTSARVAKEVVIQKQQNCDVLLMISHTGIKGIPSSKLYEYLSIQKPILLFPNDKDILEEILMDTHTGWICEDLESTEKTLTELIHRKLKNEPLYSGNPLKIHEYSTQNQAKILAGILDDI